MKHFFRGVLSCAVACSSGIASAGCVPVNPNTGQACVSVSVDQDNQFTNLHFTNDCSDSIEVKWEADKMTGSRMVSGNGAAMDQCYSYCGPVNWHAVCRGRH